MQRARSWRRCALAEAEEEVVVVLEEVVVLSEVLLAVEALGKFGTRAAWSVVVDEMEEGYLLFVRVDGDAQRESARDMDVEMLVWKEIERGKQRGRANSEVCIAARLDAICRIGAN